MIATDDSAAPEWVRALQAALRADMEADDNIGGKRIVRHYSCGVGKISEGEASPAANNEIEDEEQYDVQQIINDMLENDKKSAIENSEEMQPRNSVLHQSQTLDAGEPENSSALSEMNQRQLSAPSILAEATVSHGTSHDRSPTVFSVVLFWYLNKIRVSFSTGEFFGQYTWSWRV